MAEFRLSPKARCDLDSIFDYTLKQWDLPQALRYTDLIAAACAEFAQAPLQSQDCAVIRPGYRRRTVWGRTSSIFGRRVTGSRSFASCTSVWISLAISEGGGAWGASESVAARRSKRDLTGDDALPPTANHTLGGFGSRAIATSDIVARNRHARQAGDTRAGWVGGACGSALTWSLSARLRGGQALVPSFAEAGGLP